MWRRNLFVLLLFLSATALAQDEGFSSQPQKRAQYGWVLYAGGGAGYYLSSSAVPRYANPQVSNLSHVANLRIMWHPDHLLKFGLETGSMTFYSYKFKDSAGVAGTTRLRAVPILLEWSMALTKRLNVFAGAGTYILQTDLDYRGRSKSTKLSTGWMAAASYIHPLSTNLGLGLEGKWLTANETNTGVVALQLQLVWRFLNW